MAANASSDKQKALTSVLTQIERNFGKGSIMRLGEASRMQVETIPTGALTLDMALGGGLPKGRVIEIYGPESSGKTTLALHAIAEIQQQGGVAAFIDAEHALDPYYAGCSRRQHRRPADFSARYRRNGSGNLRPARALLCR